MWYIELGLGMLPNNPYGSQVFRNNLLVKVYLVKSSVLYMLGSTNTWISIKGTIHIGGCKLFVYI
jgi:hypothetical protein